MTVRGICEDGTVIQYRMHKFMLAAKSRWFRDSCQDRSCAGTTGTITIVLTKQDEFDEYADDIEAFKRMMHFFYHQDYRLPGDGLGNDMLLHAKVYGLAEKYDVIGLREMSRLHYSASLADHWNTDQLGSTMRMIHFNVDYDDVGLKQVTADLVAAKLGELITKPSFVEALEEIPDFSVRVMETLHTKKLLISAETPTVERILRPSPPVESRPLPVGQSVPRPLSPDLLADTGLFTFEENSRELTPEPFDEEAWREAAWSDSTDEYW